MSYNRRLSKAKASSSVTNALRGRPRGRRGSLRDFPTMPLDIIFEVVVHLRPLDLLHLARVSRDMRIFFMTKSVQWMWKAARLNVEGLPECPEDMSEPAYADLLFQKHCQVCAVRQCQSINWERRERACKECFFATQRAKSHPLYIATMASYAILRDAGLDDYRAPLLDVILSVPIPGFENLAVLRKEERSVEEGHVDQFLEKWCSLSSQERDSFLDAHQARSIKVDKHAKECRTWLSSIKVAEHREREEVERQRLNDIKLKLRKCGYDKELDAIEKHWWRSTEFRMLPGVEQPKPLTTKGWEAVRSTVTLFVENERRRLVNEKLQAEVDEQKIRVDQLEKILVEAQSRAEQDQESQNLAFQHTLRERKLCEAYQCQWSESDLRFLGLGAHKLSAIPSDVTRKFAHLIRDRRPHDHITQEVLATDYHKAYHTEHIMDRFDLLHICHADLARARWPLPTPSPLDFAITTQGRDLLHADEQVEITAEELSEALREHAATWGDAIKDLLRNVVAQDLDVSLDSFEEDPLTLAVGTYWKCDLCPYLLEYPALLHHACWTTPSSHHSDSHTERASSGSPVPLPLTWGLFPTPGLRLKSTARFVKMLMSLAGGLPCATTAAQLDSARCRFLATGGYQLPDYRAIMTWRAAVEFEAAFFGIEENSVASAAGWTLAPLEDVELCKVLESVARTVVEQEWHERCSWTCRVCGDNKDLWPQQYDWMRAKQHAIDHGISDPRQLLNVLSPVPLGNFYLHHQPAFVDR